MYNKKVRETSKIILFIAISLIAFGVFSFTANSQLLPSAASLGIEPKFPGPDTDVTVTASTIGASSLDSYFSWYLNGLLQSSSSGVGKNKFFLKTGALGSKYDIKVIISPPNAPSSVAEISFRVNDLSLVWSAQTSAPAWYKGKTLAIPESIIKVSALPTFLRGGIIENPAGLTYKWFLNGDFIADASGVGKQTFKFQTNFIPDINYVIKASVENEDKSSRQEKTILIKAVLPKIIVYPSKPLEGILTENAISGSVAANLGDTLDFVAELFFIPLADIKNLKINWEIEGQKLTGEPRERNMLNITTNINSPAKTRIRAAAENPAKIIQNLSSVFNIELK
jgi:hypothetical protein